MTQTPRRRLQQVLGIGLFAVLVVITPAASAMQQRPARQTAGELLPDRAQSSRDSGRVGTRLDYRVQSIGEVLTLPARGRFDASMAAPRRDGPQQIGVHRELPGAYRRRVGGADLTWVDVPGGRVTSIVVRSPDARAMRLAITPQRLPVGAEVVFFDADTGDLAWGPYDMEALSGPSRAAREANAGKGPQSARQSSGQQRDSAPFWSPVIEGEAIGIEIFVPRGTTDREVLFALPQISHMMISPYNTRDISDINSSGSCEVDVACDPNWSTTALAAAKEIFSTGQGTFLCTGQLLSNTRKDGRPYYSTANHCIESQAVAETATFFWFFERVTCGGADPTTVTQTSGGGDLLDTSNIETGFDFTLMQLRNSPPGGTALAGWSSSAPNTGASIVGIHHPAGDLKKISKGTVTGFDVWGGSSPSNSHVEVRWSEGVTEGGSSGSGLYLDGSWPNQPLIGVLSGGSSFCNAPDDPDVYGRLDRFFPDIARWLDPSTIGDLAEGGQVTADLSQGEWIVRRVTSSSSDAEFVVEVQSGDADLYILESIAPSRDLFDCRSWESGTTTDTCTIAGANTKTLYVGVFAYADASFTLRLGGSTGEVAPVAPENAASVAASSSAIDLSWQDLSDNETEFRINRQVAGGSWLELVRLSAGVTTHSDTGLDAGTEYCYEVIASNAVGDSPASASTCATTSAAGAAPAAPSNVGATAVSASGIDVSWADGSDNEEEFLVERQHAGGAWTALLALAANTTTLADRSLDANTEYCYRVTATNAFGTSATSAGACATTTSDPVAPAAPGGLAALAVSSSAIDLRWQDLSDNETEFRVNRQVAGGSWLELVRLGASVTAHSDTGLDAETEYCYEVIASNAVGDSPASASTCATTSAAGIAPADPGRVDATAFSDSEIDVSWVDASHNEDEFRVERQRAGGAWNALRTLAADTTWLTDYGLDPNTRYCYRVTAANAFGTSATSSAACATTDAVIELPPVTPRRLRIARRYVGGIDLIWKDKSNNETGFNIYRKLKHRGAWQLVGSVPANTRSFADRTVSRRKRYCYVVRAENGAGESYNSNRRCTRAR